MSIADVIRRLLFTEDAGATSRSPASGAGLTPADAERTEPAFRDLVSRLWKALGEQRSILSGNIHMVGLHRIRDRLGDDWPRIAHRANEMALKSIQRACGPDDLHLVYDDLSFLIIFSNLSKEQAQLRCIEIVEDITRRLLGEGISPEATEISTGVFEADGSLIFTAISKNDLVAKLTGQYGLDTQNPATAAADDPVEVEADAGATIGQPDFSPFQIDRQKALASIQVLYQPMWNLRHKAIVSYFATASARNVFSKNLWDDMVRRNFSHVLSSLEVDIYVAQTALRTFANRIAQGPRIMIGWPVHFETLANRASRNTFIEFCREIPESIRQLLTMEVDGLPEGIPNSRVLEIVSVLRPFCRVLIIRVPAEFKRFDSFNSSRIGGVGFSLSGLPVRDSQRMAMMDRFVGDASRAGLRSYVHGLSTRAQLLAAATAGFEWVNGAAVGEPSEDLGQARHFVIGDIYRDLSDE
ncbi:hypothetical protein [Ferrovibrio sp.]|uniref:hypothetical protein n=1 Tax=Ferrovibrio sp. TaxID=1917215 RepID=UPI003D11D488